jgi:hypothetical protein
MNATQRLGKQGNFAWGRPSENSEITAAEQRDNSTGISDKKATYQPQYPSFGWTT